MAAGNNLEEMPAFSGEGPYALEILEIHKNRVATIPDDYFTKLPALKRCAEWHCYSYDA